MYLLPISTYSDYWRSTRVWSLYLGGLAVIAAGTRYVAMGPPAITRTTQATYQQTTQALNIYKLGTEVAFSDLRNRVSSRAIISRAVSSQGEPSRGVASRGEPSRGVASPGVSSLGIERVSSKIEVVTIEILFDTRYVESDELLPGKSKVQEIGEKGILRQVVKTFESGGQISDQQVVSSLELKSPKKEVILRSSKPVLKKSVIAQSSKTAPAKGVEVAKMNSSRTLNVEATGYTYTGNKTSTGAQPREGMIAVDPKVIAMGSKVYVEGYGYAIAADTGGAIRGNRIDLFFPTLRQCIDWGRKSVLIYVLNPS